MAVLARYGNVQPSEFAEMDHHDSRLLAVEVEKLYEAECQLSVELAKAQMRASGARVN